MEKSNFGKKSLVLLVSLSLLSAISIILGKYLALSVGEFLRFSFENLPILFAGIAFGPLAGAAVGSVADLVGCVLVGYAINPVVTLGAVAIGFVSGGVSALLSKFPKIGKTPSVIAAVSFAHIIGSVVIKTVGLAAFYALPLPMLFLWRGVNYLIIAVLEALILVYLFRSKIVMKLVFNATQSGGEKFKSYANSFQAVTVPGLERISALMKKLGNPEKKLRFIHVAGTNGKGSVSANLAAILEDAGYKTGKYISPNLIRVNERISVCGVDISDEDMNSILGQIEPLAELVAKEEGIAPTQFEIWTALAFVYFERMGCDFVVLEVGLGGELDATNVIEKNELAIITRLGMDHMQYLGNTIAEVASAKAGIMKENSTYKTVITPMQEDAAMRVIERRAEELSHKVTVPSPTPKALSGMREIFTLPEISRDIICGIPGYHQIENASLAAEAALTLGIPEDAILSGIARAKNPARFELISENPMTVYDGGHNENGIRALNFTLNRYFGKEPKTVIFACMADKDISESLSLLSEGDVEFIYTEVKNNPRALAAEKLAEAAADLGFPGTPCENIGDALRLAESKGRLTVICGSLYLYKDLREYLDQK